MAIARLYNLARMSTATTGTGTITLGSAATGFLSFDVSGVSDGETITYGVKDGVNSEIGRGVYTSSGTTLTRTVLKSTNSNAAISLSGSAEVFITVAADDMLLADTAAFGTDNILIRTDGTGKNMQSTGISVDDNNYMSPTTSDAGALGTSSLMWSDLFLASGAVINFNNGDVTVTHSANTLTFAGAASGYSFDALITSASVNAASTATTIPPHGFDAAVNLGLTATVASSALTITVKGANGSDASATNPVLVPFRSATAATGTPVWRTLTAALSLVVSSGSTLGTTNSNAFRLWVVMFDDAGTLRLGVINPITSGISESAVVSSTAEGGAGSADSSTTFYTSTAVSSKAYRLLGFLDYPSGLATAGTWSAAPTTIQIYGVGVARFARQPGTTAQVFSSGSGTYTTPSGCIALKVRVLGAGGGGGGSGTSPGNGAVGGNSTFGSLTGNGGNGTTSGLAPGGGGTASGGSVNLTGNIGGIGIGLNSVPGGAGGSGVFGGLGGGGTQGGTAGTAALANTGGGGGGGGAYVASGQSGAGGSAGGYCEGFIPTPNATYSYAIGSGGSAGTAGTSGYAGGAGGSGLIIVEEFY